MRNSSLLSYFQNSKGKASPSKPREMPANYIPLHFLSWLKNGPASDNPHPLWIPDTGKGNLKQKFDILDPPSGDGTIGTVSNYGRKQQRMLESKEKGPSPTVLDLSASDPDAQFMKEYVKNSSAIVALLQDVVDTKLRRINAVVLNAECLYRLDSSERNKSLYLAALEEQREYLTPSDIQSVISPVPDAVKEHVDLYDNDFATDDINFASFPSHSLDDSFTAEDDCDV